MLLPTGVLAHFPGSREEARQRQGPGAIAPGYREESGSAGEPFFKIVEPPEGLCAGRIRRITEMAFAAPLGVSSQNVHLASDQAGEERAPNSSGPGR